MLNFSSFIKTSYEHRKKPSHEQCDFITDFLAEILPMDVGNIFERPYLSNLFNGIRDLTKEIKDHIYSTPEAKKKTAEAVENWLIPNILDTRLGDYYDTLLSIIQNDDSISVSTKNLFVKLYTERKFIKFLVKAFIYAVSKDNVLLKTKIDSDELSYFLQVDRTCPLCGDPLEIKRKKNTFYKYSIIPIYPNGLSTEKDTEFDSIHARPVDSKSSYNKICVCPTCGDKYVFNPTAIVYDKLYSYKEHALSEAESDSRIQTLSLDTEITKVIDALKNVDETPTIKELRKQPLTIRKKIKDNELLETKITNDVKGYYFYVRSLLANLDDKHSHFRIIANSIQNCFLTLDESLDDQEEIYYKIVEWVMKKTRLGPTYFTASQIVVSFFVQNCEVFDEIS